MRKIAGILILLIFNIIASIRVEIKGDWFYVDGNPFFVKAVGYEVGSRPGRVPWEHKWNEKERRIDFERIKDAGFNTLRTWNTYLEEEVKLADEYGFMVIQAIWVDFSKYFDDPEFEKQSIQNVRNIVQKFKKYDNILIYLVMNEPHAEILQDVGQEKYMRGFKLLRDAVKSVDTNAYVSFSNCAMADFIPMDIWDVSCFNVYPYGPETVKKGLGFRDYISWLKRKYSSNKPLLITEFGLSVSPAGPGDWGYGGNTLEEQKEGVLWMYDSLVDAGASGAAVFIWMDGWWKNFENPDDAKKHDNEAEEWFGLLSIIDEHSPVDGSPRPVYYALKEYLNMIVVEPKDESTWNDKKEIKFRIFCDNDSIIKIKTVPEKGEELIFDNTNRWWYTGIYKIKNNDSEIIFNINAFDKTDKLISKKQIKIISPEKFDEKNVQIRIHTDKDVYDIEDSKIRVSINADKKLSGKQLNIIKFDYAGHRSMSYKTNISSDGTAQYEMPISNAGGYRGISVGLDYCNNRIGDMTTIYINPPPEIDYDGILKDKKKVLIDNMLYKNLKSANEDFQRRFYGNADLQLLFDDNNNCITFHFIPSGGGAWAYIDKMFDELIDLSKSDYVSYIVQTEKSKNLLKFQLIDEDKERWFDREVKLDSDKKTIIIDLNNIARDPYDGVETGNNKPDLDKVAGIAIIFVSKSDKESKINIKDIYYYK